MNLQHRHICSRRLQRYGLILLGLMFLLSLASAPARAQSQFPTTFVLPAGGAVIVTFEGFCRDFGGVFPRSIGRPEANSSLLPSSQVRAALQYIRNNGLAGGATALPSQYAIWQLSGVNGLPTNNATSQAVMSTANTPVTDPSGAASIAGEGYVNGVWTIEVVSWRPLGSPVSIVGSPPDYFYGVGEVRVRSRANDDRTLFFPIGLTFPPATTGSQRITAYPLRVASSAGSLPVTASGDWMPWLSLTLAGLAGGLYVYRKRTAPAAWSRYKA